MKKFEVHIWETQLVSDERIIFCEGESKESLQEMIKEANKNDKFEASIVSYDEILDSVYEDAPKCCDRWDTEFAEIKQIKKEEEIK